MGIIEVRDELDGLSRTVDKFIIRHEIVSKNVDEHNQFINGNGKEGAKTTLVQHGIRLTDLEKADKRRQSIVDTLTAGVALTLILEIVRVIFAQ